MAVCPIAVKKSNAKKCRFAVREWRRNPLADNALSPHREQLRVRTCRWTPDAKQEEETTSSQKPYSEPIEPSERIEPIEPNQEHNQ